MRRSQRLALEWLGSDEVLNVDKGVLAVQSMSPGGNSRTTLLLFPDDIFSRHVVPPIGATSLTAATQAAIRRQRLQVDNALAVSARLSRLVARIAINALMLRELSAEQRLATFLVELALRLGHRTPAGCTFEMPFSRIEMGRYLALNPDTTSRLMSRLKSRQLLALPSRALVIVPSLADLAALTPLAAALRELSPAAECSGLLDAVPAPAL